MLKPGDTLVIYKPDRVARSMRELLVLLEDQLHAREINLNILTGICGGLHRPTGPTIADKMLFMVAGMAAEMEPDLIRERTLDGLAAAHAQGRRGGRPSALDADTRRRHRPPRPRRIRHRHRPAPRHRKIHPLPGTRRTPAHLRQTHPPGLPPDPVPLRHHAAGAPEQALPRPNSRPTC